MSTPEPGAMPRPADVCRQLLAALEASEGRRKRRKRNTEPDAIGLGIKRDLLERAVQDDPAPDEFEAWLFEQCLTAGPGSGAVRAMAMDVLAEWRLAASSEAFRGWLGQGAPSDDAAPRQDRSSPPQGRPSPPAGGIAGAGDQ